MSSANRQRCPDCGRFCGVVIRSAGPTTVEKPSCVGCGLNPPRCSHEDGTVYGCKEDATHRGAVRENHRDQYWCEEHAPDGAERLPYVKTVGASATETGELAKHGEEQR